MIGGALLGLGIARRKLVRVQLFRKTEGSLLRLKPRAADNTAAPVQAQLLTTSDQLPDVLPPPLSPPHSAQSNQ